MLFICVGRIIYNTYYYLRIVHKTKLHFQDTSTFVLHCERRGIFVFPNGSGFFYPRCFLVFMHFFMICPSLLLFILKTYICGFICTNVGVLLFLCTFAYNIVNRNYIHIVYFYIYVRNERELYIQRK